MRCRKTEQGGERTFVNNTEDTSCRLELREIRSNDIILISLLTKLDIIYIYLINKYIYNIYIELEQIDLGGLIMAHQSCGKESERWGTTQFYTIDA